MNRKWPKEAGTYIHTDTHKHANKKIKQKYKLDTSEAGNHPEAPLRPNKDIVFYAF